MLLQWCHHGAQGSGHSVARPCRQWVPPCDGKWRSPGHSGPPPEPHTPANHRKTPHRPRRGVIDAPGDEGGTLQLCQSHEKNKEIPRDPHRPEEPGQRDPRCNVGSRSRKTACVRNLGTSQKARRSVNGILPTLMSQFPETLGGPVRGQLPGNGERGTGTLPLSFAAFLQLYWSFQFFKKSFVKSLS